VRLAFREFADANAMAPRLLGAVAMKRRAHPFALAFATGALLACGDADPDALAGPHPAARGTTTAPGDPDGEGHGAASEDLPEPQDAPAPDAEEAGAEDAGADAAPEPEPPKRVPSPVPGKVVTYPFGVKNPRYAAGYHTGEDYAAPTGSDVVAVRNGTVRWSNDNGGAYGRWMGLDADNGRTYVYCHLSSRALAVGAKVVAGQVIGKVGATGNVTGPHLHFEDHPLGPFVYAQVRKPAW
jgi:murein DD-endopeptidase MepM/ murein hydrolase activator NlpD